MSKLVTQAFTDYFGEVLPITIVSYDNNKYVTILKPNGVEDEIKRGYIYANKELTKRLAKVDWHIHGGGTRKSFRPYTRRTDYDVYVTDNTRRAFKTKASAIRHAVHLARKTGAIIEVRGNQYSDKKISIGCLDVSCSPNGDAVQYGHNNRRRGRQPKWLRGYGKVPRAVKQCASRDRF
jgi:hypothetical protein